MQRVRSCYIGGEWRTREGDASTTVIRNPWGGEEVCSFHQANLADVTDAVMVAHQRAQREIAPRERARILERISELLLERKEEFAVALSSETGKPIRDARLEVGRAIRNFRMSSEEADRIHGYTEHQDAVAGDDVLSFTIREPYGVVCAITPFNFPLNIASLKLGPALAGGNAVVWKPADMTPYTAMLLTELATEAGLPAGYLNLVLGGPEVGRALVDSPHIALFTFTGSVAVGHQIKARSGVRPVILELGSNAPNIVHKDANMEFALDNLVKAAFSFAGQVCVSAQRIYVHTDIFAVFLQRFVERTRQLRMGNPANEDVDVGPMISETAAMRVEAWVNEAVAEGATLHVGGVRNGSLFQPAVLTDIKPSMKVMCEELFGPVVNIVAYSTVGEAIEDCNNSQFGLQAGVFTTNLNVALAFARGLQVGSVNINQSSTARPDSMPYEGVKNSGLGSEGSRASIDTMTRSKIITIREHE